MEQDTAIGGPHNRFPSTRRSVIRAASRNGQAEERTYATGLLITAYWKPVYKYIRVQWRQSNEDAKDLTQAFFARLLEKSTLAAYDPARSGFRTWLRMSIDGFVSNELKSAGRRKRGGGLERIPLDFESAEGEILQTQLSTGVSMEEFFHREWARSIFTLAVEALRVECETAGKTLHYRLFERYDLSEDKARPTYPDLAREFALPVTQVTNHLASVRRLFRRTLLGKLRELTADEREFRNEARALLGVIIS